jgi:hypothetical protein
MHVYPSPLLVAAYPQGVPGLLSHPVGLLVMLIQSPASPPASMTVPELLPLLLPELLPLLLPELLPLLLPELLPLLLPELLPLPLPLLLPFPASSPPPAGGLDEEHAIAITPTAPMTPRTTTALLRI